MSLLPVTDTTYEVQLTLDPSIGVLENELTSIDMYSKHGQKFMCHIPDVHAKNKTIEVPELNSSYVNSLLGLNNRSACMLLKKDWWTYELCPYRHVLQFHQDGKKRVSEILLGSFDSESKWDDLSNVTKHTPLKHKQWYTNGSMCDITYHQRTVEVRYECAALAVPGITKVEEVETCVYIMSVSIPELCSHPLFVEQVPTISERIICSPATLTTKEQYDTETLKNAPSSPIRQSKRKTLDFFALRRTRRSRTNYRIVKRLLRNFLRTISAPLPQSASFGFHDAFTIYLEDIQSHSFGCSASFPLSVDRSELKQWVHDAVLFFRKFNDMLEKLASHPEILGSQHHTTRIIHSLGMLLVDLLRYKQKQVTNPAFVSAPVQQQFANASQLLFRIFEELYGYVDTNHTARLEKDLRTMYSEFSILPSPLQLETIDPDGSTPVSVPFATKKRAPLCRTPVEAASFSIMVDGIEQQLLLLQKFQVNVAYSNRLRSLESMFASTLQNLINGPQFRVVVLRGVENGDQPVGGDTDGSSQSRLSRNVLAMVKQAIQKVSPESSGTLEVYETHSAPGVSTVFIVSAEEKRKELERMKTLEQAYNYMAPNQPEETD